MKSGRAGLNTELEMALAHCSWAEKSVGALALLGESWGTGDRAKTENQEWNETDEQYGGHLNPDEARIENSVSN
jgi:hypothetical protein